MKKYISPIVQTIALSTEEGVLNVGSPQGGLGDGDGVGNQKPTGDNDENFFSNRRNSIWGNEE